MTIVCRAGLLETDMLPINIRTPCIGKYSIWLLRQSDTPPSEDISHPATKEKNVSEAYEHGRGDNIERSSAGAASYDEILTRMVLG